MHATCFWWLCLIDTSQISCCLLQIYCHPRTDIFTLNRNSQLITIRVQPELDRFEARIACTYCWVTSSRCMFSVIATSCSQPLTATKSKESSSNHWFFLIPIGGCHPFLLQSDWVLRITKKFPKWAWCFIQYDVVMVSGMSHVKKVQAHVEVQRRFIVKKTNKKKTQVVNSKWN